VRVRVKDGKVIRVDSDNTGENTPGTQEIRACLRGRALRKWIYSPERLLYPLKRAGKRGEGRFERISWNEALDLLSDKLRHAINTYGNESVFRIYGTGNLGGVVSGREQIDRLMNLLGGQLNHYNSYSTAQIFHGMTYTYGTFDCSNPLSDIVNSKLVVFFGNDPAETRMSGGGTIRDLVVAKQESKVRVVVIDPRYSDTAAAFADEWIPIRPGTDAALVSGLAHVLITERLVDENFLRRYCVGYDEQTMPDDIPGSNSYKAYIMGTGPDGVTKTPAWAAAITGIPADRIVQLAREIGTAKPVYIAQGWGPQRHANGEQSARAICMLSILTGNVGIQGGNSGGREASFGIPFPFLPMGKNPVATSIPCFLWTKAIADHENFTDMTDGLRGKTKLETPIKFIWNFASNTLVNQHSDIGNTRRILADESLCETIVVIDNVMTSSARYGDIVLPATSSFEETDLSYQGYAVEMGVLILRQEAIEPLGECRTLYDICAGVAQRLGIGLDFTEGRTHDQWVEHMYHLCRKVRQDLPESFEEALGTGLFKWSPPERPKVGLQAFREDPERSPLGTPSGKIEIFSRQLWDLTRTWKLPEGDVISALPEYHHTWGMPPTASSDRKHTSRASLEREHVSSGNVPADYYRGTSRQTSNGDVPALSFDPARTPSQLQTLYPLQLIGHHHKQRTHSSYGNNPWLQEVAPHSLWINPLDADARGINHGDMVRVFNEIGETMVRAKVTPRIMPGVLSLPQGAWYQPDKDNIDKNGCINTLTSQRSSPLAKGNPQHTNLVQVEKVE
jgi:DmsA/YnfE family anaerobic dimethyl sulfoxide reductase A subunit